MSEFCELMSHICPVISNQREFLRTPTITILSILFISFVRGYNKLISCKLRAQYNSTLISRVDNCSFSIHILYLLSLHICSSQNTVKGSKLRNTNPSRTQKMLLVSLKDLTEANLTNVFGEHFDSTALSLTLKEDARAFTGLNDHLQSDIQKLVLKIKRDGEEAEELSVVAKTTPQTAFLRFAHRLPRPR